MKYTVCIGRKAKDALDRYRLSSGLGRFPLRNLVHKGYADNRPPGARRNDTMSVRQRPVNVTTNLVDTNLVDMLELVDMLDVVGRYSNTDDAMVSHLLGTFLDAVIMGDLVDTTAPFVEGVDLNKISREEQIAIAEQASQYNLSRAASKGKEDNGNT